MADALSASVVMNDARIDQALLDADILYPAVLCRTVLDLAEAGLFLPRWSEPILDEVERNLRLNIGGEGVRRRVEAMRHAFPGAMVAGFEYRIPAMTNDSKDRHVLAAAVESRSTIIVTNNRRHFPPAALRPVGIVQQTSDEFLADLYRRTPGEVRAVLRRQAIAYRNPPMTLATLLDRLARHAPTMVAMARPDFLLDLP